MSSTSIHITKEDPTIVSPQTTDRGTAVIPFNEYEDAERNFRPRSLKFWTILLGVYLAVFLVALDQTIIATAIPQITNEFNSIKDIGWYGSAYMLTAACCFPMAGRIYQLYSTKWVFIGSIVVFEVGSTICGAAPSSTVLIVGRAVAGSGSSGIFCGGTMTILPLVPLRRRPVFNSLFGMVFGVSSVLGPILGGTLTDHVTWRWCFYINLPIGAFTLVALLVFFRVESPKRDKSSFFTTVKQFDPVGVLLFMPSIVCLLLALEWGGSTSSWSEPKVIGLLVAFAALFILFVTNEALTPATAMTPTRVVLNRSIAGSMVFMFLLSGGLMSIIYYLTLWFQAVKSTTAMQAGINTIPIVLTLVIIGILAAALTETIHYYNPSLLLSPLFCATGAGLLSILRPGSSSAAWIGYQVLYGIGIGIGFQTANLPAQHVLPRKDVPLGLALMFFMQQLGGSVFLAASQNIFSSRLVSRLSSIDPDIDAQAIVNNGATRLRDLIPPTDGKLERAIEAYSHSLTRIFVVSAALSATMLLGAVAVRWEKIPTKEDTTQADAEADQDLRLQ